MSNQQSTTGRIMQTVSVDFCACGKIIGDGKCSCGHDHRCEKEECCNGKKNSE